MKKTLLILGIVIIAAGFSAAAYADDLLIQNQTISDTQIFDSPEATIIEDTVMTPTADMTVISTFEVILRPGTRIQSGAKFTARMKDFDGLSNRCEMTYFGHLNWEPIDDPDQDLLNNLIECTLGTNPNVQDFDNDDDGLPDWWEVKYGGATLAKFTSKNQDYDGDGVSNWVEFQLGSDPSTNDLPGPGIHYEYDELGRIIKILRIPAQ